jgi:hypothetical protein
MHFVGYVDSEDMNMTSGKTKYSSLLGYSNSKLAQVLLQSYFTQLGCHKHSNWRILLTPTDLYLDTSLLFYDCWIGQVH